MWEVPNAEGVDDVPKAEGGLFNPAPNKEGLFVEAALLPNAPVPEEAGGVPVPPKAVAEDC